MPSLPPPRLTELYYDGVWHNISGDMRESVPVTLTRGVSAEGSRSEPGTATALLDNRSGDYSPRDPNSALHDKIGRNTPWRFSVKAGGPWVELSHTHDAITTPGTGMAVTTDLDVRLDLTTVRTGIQQHIAGRYTATGNQRSWALTLSYNGIIQLRWSPDGTTVKTLISTQPLPMTSGQRGVLRVTLDVDNGASGHTARFYYGQSMASRWQAIGNPVTGAGTTSVWGGTGQLEFGSVPDVAWQGWGGKAHALQLRNGIDGPLLVDLDVAAQGVAGAATLTDDQGRVWTLRDEAHLSNLHVRMVGEVPAWPPSRDLSGADRTVAIAPAGIMRRLGAGNRPLDSALRRYMLGSNALECWPLTDGEQATQGAAMRGSAPVIAAGKQAPPLWGKGTLADWIEPVAGFPDQRNGALTATPGTVGTASWSVDHVRSGAGLSEVLEMHDRGRGTEASNRTIWRIYTQAVPNQILIFRETVAADSSSMAFLATVPDPGIFDDRPHHIRFRTVVSGGATAWWLDVDGENLAVGSEALTGQPLGRIEYLWDQEAAEADDLSLGYLTVWNADQPSAATVHQAVMGFPGETAGARALRLSAETGVPISVSGEETHQTRLGIQRPEKYLDSLATIAKSDLGYLVERRDALELAYRARGTLYNQAPTITLSFADGVIGEPFRPLDDDKLSENDITVKRSGGTTGRAVLESGRMSVQDPPNGIGRYDRDYTLSLEADHQTGEHAQWRMHLGTFDGLRYTKVTLNLANPRVYAMIADIYRADVGDLVRLTDLPADHGPGPVDLIIRGYSEEIGAGGWTITFNCAPGSPWSVGVADDRVLGRADTDGSELAAAVTSTATTWPVTVTAGPAWLTTAANPTEFPLDVTCDGEQATVTRITGVAEDAFARTVASGWGAADSGQAWVTDGGSAADYAVSAGTGRHIMSSRGVFRHTYVPVVTADVDLRVDFSLSAVPAADSAYVFPMIRYQDVTHMYLARVQIAAGGAMTLTLRKRDGGETQLGSSYATGLTYTAGAWYTVRLAMTGSELSAKVWLRSGTEPVAWQVTATDAALTAPASVGVRTVLGSATTNVLPVTVTFDNLYVGPQAMTVIRSVNGIVKGHAAGAALSLTHPMRAAL
ncbi:hypothetical protein [Streptomyces fulvorobeus]|uniref:Uncharacterized protein n=1 Tax=Streptomyces fulvorobeus TaxID=284028 RepID=A0A7J0C392_9ACTN|nr:hypothetical protein [Streptomyces fulvorobeus]NYE40682.1 hypothetical protein [Streptomyces fulvorobeus]GFM96985.1 hypothetical protein Sfulv_17960 [Streptomyces fulvorobeus]